MDRISRPDTRGWTGTDFSGNNAPTSLDGVSVSIGGQAAFVDYISPTQVNAQLPSSVFTAVATSGMFPLTVTSGGVTSAPYDLTVNPTQPGLLATAQFKIGANQYVVAQHSDGAYVLPTGSIAGANSRPAQPGETVVIYGIGFGAVTPDHSGRRNCDADQSAFIEPANRFRRDSGASAVRWTCARFRRAVSIQCHGSRRHRQ